MEGHVSNAERALVLSTLEQVRAAARFLVPVLTAHTHTH